MKSIPKTTRTLLERENFGRAVHRKNEYLKSLRKRSDADQFLYGSSIKKHGKTRGQNV